jgi:hypothetical protein
MFGVSLGSISDIKNSFSDALTGGLMPSTVRPSLSMFYTVNPNDWYKTYPFYFEFETTDGNTVNFYLPVPPQQMTIQHVSTSEAHPTVGGVVTEISAPVFYMINMAGTTGVSLNALGVSNPGSEVKQRQTFDELTGGSGILSKAGRSLTKNISDLAGGIVGGEPLVPFYKQGSAVNTVPEESLVKDAPGRWESLSSGSKSGSGSIAGAIGKMVGQVAKSLVGNMFDKKEASWYLNGFTWEHALKQFFLIYQRERSKGTAHVLYFYDIKSNNRYACIPKNVQFTKSTQNPYASTYQIALKCWSDQKDGSLATPMSPSEREAVAVDRFSGDLAEVYTVSAAAVITRVTKTIKKLKRVDDVGGAMARDAGGSTF